MELKAPTILPIFYNTKDDAIIAQAKVLKFINDIHMTFIPVCYYYDVNKIKYEDSWELLKYGWNTDEFFKMIPRKTPTGWWIFLFTSCTH